MVERLVDTPARRRRRTEKQARRRQQVQKAVAKCSYGVGACMQGRSQDFGAALRARRRKRPAMVLVGFRPGT